MKVRVRNNSEAPQGVEKVGGGYKFAQPGETITVNAANAGLLYKLPFLDVEALEAQVPEMPASLAEKVAPKHDPLDHDNDGRKGGSTSVVKDVTELRAEYHRVVGKRPFNGWDAATLREKIAAASK